MSKQSTALRCAVYTRKSSDEGLDQEFNSLHAQREACEAYVVSQRSEGWTLLSDQYDDGGFSGGTLERPALQQLIADIEAGRVDVVMVYKIDRLTRSLMDFSKLVEVLERNGVTFVSITQSFNTTTSMGRLMLNVLLSFAQFEREVTGERIRDKIAASKAKGMWMGGRVPLGYRVENRALVIDEAEAEVIRTIFALYLELKNVRLVAEALQARGIHSGGGKPFSRGHLYKLLSSPLYVGKVEHKGKSYKGQHQPIIDKATWDAVEAQLVANTRGKRSRPNIKEASLLAGLLFNDQGRALAPTHAVKSGRRYRYYAASADAEAGAPAFRLAAGEVEQAVMVQVGGFLGRTGALIDELGVGDLPPERLKSLIANAEALSEAVCAGGAGQRALLLDIVERVTVAEDAIVVRVKRQALASRLLGDAAPELEGSVVLEAPARLTRRGVETKLVIEADGASSEDPTPDPALVKAVARGHAWFEDLVSGRAASVSEIARREGLTPRYVSRLLELAFLPPRLVEAILAGTQPVDMTAEALTRGERGLVWENP